MTSLHLVPLNALAAFLCLRKRLRKAALFLSAVLISEGGRTVFASLRSGFPRPYQGAGFLLWLPDPALFLALPAVLLGLAVHPAMGVAAWLAGLVLVALEYPELRGERLIHLYEACYLAAYALVTLITLGTIVKRRLYVEEGLTLLFALTGSVSVLMVIWFGSESWWGVWIPNAASYLAAILAATALTRTRPA